MLSVELSEEEVKEIIHALNFTENEGCETGNIDIYELMEKLGECIKE